MKRPSNITLSTAKKAWWVLPSFKYLMLCGTAYAHSQSTVDRFNKNSTNNDRVHETIHVRQAQSTSDSWILFYIQYIWNWIKGLPLVFVNIKAPYKFHPMEVEAYGRQDSPSYIDHGACTAWRAVRDLPMSTKRSLAKEYYNGICEENGKRWTDLPFSDFINSHFSF